MQRSLVLPVVALVLLAVAALSGLLDRETSNIISCRVLVRQSTPRRSDGADVGIDARFPDPEGFGSIFGSPAED